MADFPNAIVELVEEGGRIRVLPVGDKFERWHVRFPRSFRDEYSAGDKFIVETLREGPKQYIQVGNIYKMDGTIVYSNDTSSVGKKVDVTGVTGTSKPKDKKKEAIDLNPRLSESLSAFATRIGKTLADSEELYYKV